MNLLRSLFAALFAIAFANPACCCTQPKAEEPVHACCGGGKKKEPSHGDSSCLCAAKQPKQAEDPPALPFFAAVELPPAGESPFACGPPVAAEHPPIQPGVVRDTGPPRRRLILLQRWLI